MDESFRVRAEKVFGSLASPHSSSSLGTLWSLTDDEVEKREWKRDKGDTTDRDDDATPCSSSFEGFLKKDRRKQRNHRRGLEDELDDLNDDDDDDDGDGGSEQLGRGSSNQSFERDDDDRDVWEIRSSIGLDRTLDNEAEEDEYDRVALGRENSGDRLYMGDVTNRGSCLSSHNVLPNSLHVSTRDPRANHLAARIRLKEDEVAAQNSDSCQACDKTVPDVMESHIKASEDGGNLKSILKRKENAAISRLPKRVRFDTVCKSDCGEASEKSQDFFTRTPSMERTVSDDKSLLTQDSHRVPDYILNPSRYTHYSFDSSSGVDEESNNRACMDSHKSVKKSKPIESEMEDASADLPKSVIFIPKKKASDAKAVDNSSEIKQSQEGSFKHSSHHMGFPVGIAAGEAQQSQVSAMEDDEPGTNAADESASSKKPGRQYRTKSSSDDVS